MTAAAPAPCWTAPSSEVCPALCRYRLPVPPWCALVVAHQGPHTAAEVAHYLAITTEHAEQITTRASAKLRARLKRRMERAANKDSAP